MATAGAANPAQNAAEGLVHFAEQLKAVLEPFAKWAERLKAAADPLTRQSAAARAFGAGLAVAGKGLSALTGGFATASKALLGLVTPFEQLASAGERRPRGLGGTASEVGQAALGTLHLLAAPFNALKDTLLVFRGDFTSFAKAVTGVGLLEAFTHLTRAARGFVEALNPNVIFAFQWAIRNVQATIGTAFQGMFAGLTRTINGLPSILAPAARALAPVFNTLGRAAGELLTQLVRAVSRAVEVLQPVFAIYAQRVELFGRALQALSAVVLAGLDVLGDWFKGLGDPKDMMKSFEETIHHVISQLVLFAAALAKMFGATTFIDKLKDRLKEAGKAGGPGGAQASGPVAITGIEAIVRDLAKSAALAGAGGGAELDEGEWRKQVLEDLKNLDTSEMLATLNKVKTAAENLLREAEQLPERAKGWWGDAQTWALEQIKSAGSALYDAAVGLSGQVLGEAARRARQGFAEVKRWLGEKLDAIANWRPWR